jgi:hypothetical protein
LRGRAAQAQRYPLPEQAKRLGCLIGNMTQAIKLTRQFLFDAKSIIFSVAIFNFILVWYECSNASGGGVIAPGYFPWSYFNEPTLILVVAICLRIDRVWAGLVSSMVSGYLIGYWIWLFATYWGGFKMALHYELATFKYQAFIGSWDSQYLLATLIFFVAASSSTRRIISHRA